MKAGTAARLFNLAVAIVILAVALVPILQSVSQSDMNSIRAGTQAVYELEYMDEYSLKSNLQDAVSGRTGCTVTYGESAVPVDGDNLDTVVAGILGSGAERAVVKDSEGKTIVQNSIVYNTPLLYGMRTGVQLGGMAEKVSKVELRAHLVSPSGDIDIVSNSHDPSIDGEISAGFVIPSIAYNIAAANKCFMGVKISISYEGLATVSADVGNKDVISSDAKYEFGTEGGKNTLTVTGCPQYTVGTAKIGDLDVSFSGKTMTISSTEKISVALRNSMEDGCIRITMGDDSYVMDRQMSESLVKAIESMEASS